MTGTTLSSATLDPRRKRILFRAWHRGTREMDLLFGSFADRILPDMPEAELGALEALLDLPDPQLYAWLTGRETVPAATDTPLFRRFAAHRPPIAG